MNAPDRLKRQIEFLAELDKLKQVFRQTYLLDVSRMENDAEHSWHFALAAMVLAEYAEEPIDVGRVLRMALVHDIVEIDAGDVYRYDDAGNAQKAAREQVAADRIFALLPKDQAREFRALWEEFEDRQMPEARFAHVLDRLMPLMHNYLTQGRAWQDHGVTADRVRSVNAIMGDGSAALWQFAQSIIDDAVAKGYLAPPAGAPHA
jgi:putative hydrolase of HD superfamily